MNDLSKLLETHTEQNTRLRDQNNEMASRMGSLVGETEKRDQVVAGMQKEAMLQIELLQHQVSGLNLLISWKTICPFLGAKGAD